MKNLKPSEIKDLIDRYQSELRKLEYRVQRTKHTIQELQKEVSEKDISSDLEAPTKPSKKKRATPAKKTAKKPSSKAKKSSKGPGRPPKHVLPGRESETRNGHRLNAWDQMIFDTIEGKGEALKTKSIIAGVKDEASKHGMDASAKYIRQKVSQSIHKLANKHKLLKKADAEGRGYAYAPKEWFNSQGKLKTQYRTEKTKETKPKKTKKKQKKSTGRRGRPPKHDIAKAGDTETRGGYKLSAWDQMIFDVIENTGQALKTKDIIEGAKKWASKNNIDASRKYLRQKVAASIHKLSNKHKTLKKVDAEGRGYAYAPEEWTNSKGNLMKKYQPKGKKSTGTQKTNKTGKKPQKKKTTGRRGRPPKHDIPKAEEPKTKEGYKLSGWDQMIFDAIENAGEALKTKSIIQAAKKWASNNNIDADNKYLRQKIAASIHKLSNKHKTLKKVKAEGRGYAYAPKDWFNSRGNLMKKYRSEKTKATSKSNKKSSSAKSGKRSRKKPGGYKLSDWDEMIIQSIEKEGKALKNNEIMDHAMDWAKKEGKTKDEKKVKSKVSQSLHKLSNKHKTLNKVDAEGRGYAYAPKDWTNSKGNLKNQYQRK